MRMFFFFFLILLLNVSRQKLACAVCAAACYDFQWNVSDSFMFCIISHTETMHPSFACPNREKAFMFWPRMREMKRINQKSQWDNYIRRWRDFREARSVFTLSKFRFVFFLVMSFGSRNLINWMVRCHRKQIFDDVAASILLRVHIWKPNSEIRPA